MQSKQFGDRVDQIKQLQWQEIQELAIQFDIQKPEGGTWKDVAEAIARAEFDSVSTPSEIITKSASSYPTDFYESIGVLTGSDGDKIKTDSDGRVINK